MYLLSQNSIKMKFLTKEQTMNYTLKIEDWDTIITIETNDLEVLEKLSEVVILAMEEVDEDEEEDAE
jgi:hypothetical protein